MEIEKTEQYVRDLLAVCGYSEDNTESHLYDLLFHQYMAAALYETASAADRTAVDAVTKKLKVFFQCNFKLKERKRRKKEKQENTPTPPKEEIDKEEEIEQKIYISEKENFGSDLEKRKETFRQVGTGYAVHAGSIGKGSYEATQRMAGGEPKTAPSGENPQEVLHTQTGEINSRRDWRTV